MRSIGSHLFKSDFSKEVKESFDSIPLWLKGKTEYQKIDFLLTLVDQAFPHSGGDKIEKENYVEQTMKDDFVDCEDRAAMFCYLVKEFTNFNTSLVVSTDHAWSVVSESNNFHDKYIMCDPGMPLGKMLEPNKKYQILDTH
jgi:hypothetical protein